jgi:hypothetical protein
LFEDAQSDILLLLDTCSVRDAPMAGSHGIKQGIAACGPENNPKQAGGRSFTSNLIEALAKLSTGRPFTVQRLFEEIYSQKQQELSVVARMTNGAGRTPHPAPQLPIFFTLTPGKGQSLSLSPLPVRGSTQLQSLQNGADGESQSSRVTREDQLIDPESVVDLRFEEQRVLVCTTFVGEASPDMSSFNQWLHNTPPLGAKITVEGMFLGPPTMLLISMPHSVWNIVQHDKVCCFLGYISSHNMIHLYQQLVGSINLPKVTPKEVEDGRILLEAREVATKTPTVSRRDPVTMDSLYKEAFKAINVDKGARQDNGNAATGGTPSGAQFTPANATATSNKVDVEDSAEMQEAAEQLKALSHVRHLSDETPTIERRRTGLPTGIPDRHEDTPSSPSANDSGADDTIHAASTSTPTTRLKPRRSLQKQPTKLETRCSHCSHAPFKDSSSLRKHIAAAHTRPFPCAFSFAGCTSTFGSKNEWKRHIASQHLCLQYYRCSACPQSTVEGKSNEFNRKDLFTQHLRRMHAPFAIKKAIAKGDGKLQVEWEMHVKDMQQTCLVTRRQPPQRSACPKPECQNVFEGPGAWDEWTEHVGRHMEKGEGQRLGVDRLLAKWALAENIIERKENGEYRLTAGNGGPASGEAKDSISVAYPENLRQDGDDQSITAAESAEDKMEVDS